MVSPDSFTVVTTLADYYYASGTGTYNSYTISKTVKLINNIGAPYDSRLEVTFSFSGYPNPNNFICTIYVQSATAVTSLVKL